MWGGVREDPPPIANPNLCRNRMESFGLETLKNVNLMSVLMHDPKRKNILRLQIAKPENHFIFAEMPS